MCGWSLEKFQLRGGRVAAPDSSDGLAGPPLSHQGAGNATGPTEHLPAGSPGCAPVPGAPRVFLTLVGILGLWFRVLAKCSMSARPLGAGADVPLGGR